MDSPKYSSFDILEATYKVINSHDIKAFILVPKNASSGKHPVIAKFHGGFFCTGASLYPDWFPQWALDYSILHSAIIIAGDYRLMPESNGLDIMEDLNDFWTWVRTDLQPQLTSFKPGVEADLSKIIAYGESAGGNLAIQSGFTQPVGFIKAVIGAYPLIDFDAKHEKPILGAPTIPPEVLEAHVRSMEPGKIVTSAFPPERMHLSLSMAQQGRLKEFFGADESLYVMNSLEKIDQAPFIFILHGKDDTAVPIEGTFRFEEVARKKFGPGKVEIYTAPGDHGFDGAASLETPGLREGLSNVTKFWLG